MTRKCFGFVGIGVVGSFVACSGSGEPADRELSSLEELHGDDVTAVSSLPAFRGRGLGELEPEDVWLVRGEVSKSSLTRVARRDVPASVEEARLPLFVERRAQDLLLLPLERLEPEADYTVLALGAGELGRFSTNAEVLLELERAGRGSVVPGEWVSYCALEPDALGEGFVAEDVFESADLSSEAGERGCVRFRIPENATGYLPVPSLRGTIRLSPEPLWVGPSRAVECPPTPEFPFEESGGFLAVTVPAGFSQLRIEGSGPASVAGVGDPERVLEERALFEEAGPLVVGPLAPDTEYRVTLWHLSGACETTSSLSVRTGGPAPRFVLTEVYADPQGPEPAGEWIELRNIGSRAGSVAGYRLRDGAGEVELPAVTIPESGAGLIVRADYRAGGLDPTPASTTIPIVVPKLGGNGLSNSGEEIFLVGLDGLVVSSLPLLPAESGQSWERREPWLPDVLGSFVSREPTPGL